MSGRLSASFGASRFDAQATGFDRRAGLPAEAVEAIAAAVVATATSVPGGVLLEIGAGTGEIGVELVRVGGMPYVGVDASLSMLARFRSRLRASSVSARRGAIAHADAHRPWPIGVGRARIVFVSRALHLLELGRVAAELRACAHAQGCAVVVGRVQRARDSVRSMLRRQMKSLLAARGITGRSGGEAARLLSEVLAGSGAQAQEPRSVATWTAEERPAQIIAAWRGKPGLAGVALPPDVQAAVLDELEAWASARFAGLDAPRAARDEYELTVIDIPARSAASDGLVIAPTNPIGGTA
jgi:hypothetical protein